MRSALAIPLALVSAVAAAPLPDVIDLAAPPAGLPITEIIGARTADRLGMALAPAGDWNADGRQDLVIGSPFASHPVSGLQTGVAHVVLGTGSLGGTIDLLAPAGAVTEIRGVESPERCGWSVAGIGDWNADGFDDIGAPLARPDGITDQGRVTVLFGGPSPPSVIELASLEATQGVTLSETTGGGELGFAVAGVGDFNDDGIDDLAAGSPNADFGALDAGGPPDRRRQRQR